jgi:flagellar motor switch protein FliM
MTPSAHHLGRVKIHQLLAALGSTPAPAGPERSEGDRASPPALPYDWRDPHFFNTDQQNRLVQVLEQTAARMAEIFARSRHGVFEVTRKSLTQHFAGDLCRRWELDRDQCVTFAPEKGPPCGFVSISPRTALTWVTWLLGDSEAGRDPNRALSALEESLLSDLLTAVLAAFLAPLQAPHHLRPTGPMSKGQPNLQFELTEEVARVVFQVKAPMTAEEAPGAESGAGDSEPCEVAFLLPCRRLAALAGKTAPQELSRVAGASARGVEGVPPSTRGPEALDTRGQDARDTSQALMEHLQEMPVTITALLASTTLTFQEILDLGPGDILLLDKPVDGPVELVFNGRTVLHGRPAQAEGRQAVVIVAPQAEATRPTAAARTATSSRKDTKGNA